MKCGTAIPVTIGLLLCTAASAAPAQNDGQRAYEWGHYGEARRLWLPAAASGDPEAAFGMALLYDLGRGVKEDAATAYGWYLRAATGGMAAAAFNVGVMNDSGYGVARNSAAAALWYARAAAGGNARAAYNLGLLYADGEGVPKNPALARAWYAMAAHDLPAAAAKLAVPTAPADGGAGKLIAPEADQAALVTGQAQPVVELVWSAPAEPVPVRYYYTVVGMDGTGPHAIAADSLDRSATLVPISSTFTSFAWRVYAVSDTTAHYAASAWRSFTRGSEPPSH